MLELAHGMQLTNFVGFALKLAGQHHPCIQVSSWAQPLHPPELPAAQAHAARRLCLQRSDSVCLRACACCAGGRSASWPCGERMDGDHALLCFAGHAGERRLEEQLAALLEARMDMDAAWAAAQAQAVEPQQVSRGAWRPIWEDFEQQGHHADVAQQLTMPRAVGSCRWWHVFSHLQSLTMQRPPHGASRLAVCSLVSNFRALPTAQVDVGHALPPTPQQPRSASPSAPSSPEPAPAAVSSPPSKCARLMFHSAGLPVPALEPDSSSGHCAAQGCQVQERMGLWLCVCTLTVSLQISCNPSGCAGEFQLHDRMRHTMWWTDQQHRHRPSAKQAQAAILLPARRTRPDIALPI